MLFVYGDQFKQTLLAAVKIEVQARPVIYTKVMLKHQSQHTLSLPSDKARSVRISSNKPKEVFQQASHAGKQMRLIPNSINHISVMINFQHE